MSYELSSSSFIQLAKFERLLGHLLFSDLMQITVMLFHYYIIYICLHTGYHKDSEACHLDGNCCQRHIWNLLGCRVS